MKRNIILLLSMFFIFSSTFAQDSQEPNTNITPTSQRNSVSQKEENGYSRWRLNLETGLLKRYRAQYSFFDYDTQTRGYRDRRIDHSWQFNATYFFSEHFGFGLEFTNCCPNTPDRFPKAGFFDILIDFPLVYRYTTPNKKHSFYGSIGTMLPINYAFGWDHDYLFLNTGLAYDYRISRRFALSAKVAHKWDLSSNRNHYQEISGSVGISFNLGK